MADDTETQVAAWLTTGDRRHLLELQPPLHFEPAQSVQPMRVILDATRVDQEIDGFGAALTDSAAWVLTSYLTAGAREQLLQELFTPTDGIGLGYLRVPIGASDFALYHYTYDDMPNGQRDPDLRHFSIAHDEAYILPILRRVRAINPHLKIMASPWSPPGWMKRRWLPGNPLYGGRLRRDCYDVYAHYLVAFIRAYMAAGVPIDALTVQNEPGFGSFRYPSMKMDADEQAEFVRQHLGPALARAELATKIVIWDHNWDNPGYPKAVLNNPGAKRFVAGTAFHCYSFPPRPEAQSLVRAAHPDRDIYFTECTGMIGSDFASDLRWMMRYLLIGATRHGARAVLLWNLALDEHGNPHTGAGGQCRGVVSVTARGKLERNVEYYALGHASRFVLPGAYRIAATSTNRQIETVAFHNPDCTTVLIALNDDISLHTFTVYWGGESFCYALEAGAVATFIWQGEPAPALLDMSVVPEPTLEPDVMPMLHGWAAVRQWIDNRLQSLAPLIARRLGWRGLLALVVGGSLLAWLVYRRIRRRPQG
ncbi:MAG TPA: glycoside hydrolase family 30 beta sandwich domain-containing protein [Aggregatilineaceae bacterium]|nr:glycoside hydrolase family 30 beta sandwich domain-containing protein [Aggregatilineaceae bacterium]